MRYFSRTQFITAWIWLEYFQSSHTINYQRKRTFSLINKGSIGGRETIFVILSKSFRPSSKGCSASKAIKLADDFSNVGKVNSTCPDDAWLQDMSDSLSQTRRKILLINIGVNKGYNFASWMNAFAPGTGMSFLLWHNLLENFGITNCGCHECSNSSVNVSPLPPVVDYSNIVMVGLDINERNIRLISNVVKLGQETDKFRFHGLTLLGIHAAGTNQSGIKLNVPDCFEGDENCEIISTGKEEGINVNGITIDDLVYNIYKEDWMTSDKISAEVKHLPLFSRAFDKSGNQKLRGAPRPHRTSQAFSSHSNSRVLRQESKQDSNHIMDSDLPIVDILEIDTEGHDPAVLQGASELIRRRGIRCIMFEYHGLGLWKSVQLEDVVHVLDLHDYDCYFQGHSRLWPITGKSSVATVMCHLLDLRPSRRNFTNIYICLL